MKSINNMKRISANGKSKFFTLCTILLLALVFNGCSKEDKAPSLVSGSISRTITAEDVENAGDYDIRFVWAVINPEEDSEHSLDFDERIAEGTYSNDGFSIQLPSSVNKGHLKDIRDFFEDYLNVSGSKLKYSDPDAQIVDIDFIALNQAKNGWFGFFANIDDGDDDDRIWCLYVYVDSDVDVTGGPTVSFSRGWNRLYYSSGKNLVTTKEPKGMTWYLFENN